MSALKKLDVARGLELLKRLDGILDVFGKEERELNRELRSRERKVEREAEERIAAAEVADECGAGATREFLKGERARLTAKREGRCARIEMAGRDALRALPRRAQEEWERWLGEMQMRHVSRSRELAAARGAAEENRAQEVLARQAARLRKLRGRARDSFTGFLGHLIRLQWGKGVAEATKDVEGALDDAERELAEFRRLVLPRVLSFAPLPVLLGGLAFAVFWFGEQSTADPTLLWTVGGVVAVGLLILHVVARLQSRERSGRLIAAVRTARVSFAAAQTAAEQKYGLELKRIADEEAALEEEIESRMERAGAAKASFDARERERVKMAVPRALARNEVMFDARLARLEREVGERLTKLEAAGRSAGEVAMAEGDAAREAFETERERCWADLLGRWDAEIGPVYAEIRELNAVAVGLFPEWTAEFVEGWEPAERFLPTTKFARLDVSVPMAADSRLELPGAREVSIPLALAYPETGSLLFETPGVVDRAVMSCLNQVILRLLATTPPGKVSFTLLDPVGLGQNFAGLMHLGDYEESLITRRIWTQSDQIEERLAELNAHIEKVIQMYLRDEYATIAEYNERAGSTAEKYHFLVIADFPAGFSETAIKRLQSVVASGPRCGVHTLIHWDLRQSLPTGFPAAELRSSSVCVQGGRDGLTLDCGTVRVGARLVLDPAPSAELGLKFIEALGSASVDSNRVEVPFEQIAPEVLWEGDTTRELRVAIGRSGATKQQMLAIGKGTRQHALIAGKTGSGKSTLFHVIVTNLALTCSPREVEFYLIDFKKGVEFKCYASKRLPHARVVAVESDREFGLSVLERLDEELRRRGDLFRKAGVQDLAGYRREAGESGDCEALPRTLLMIDEFQEFFVEDDATAQSASVLLDRIVRQGRAFGIHVILGSQTLGGAYSLARATLGQMAIRVALQCNEADAYLIMDDDNSAPRLLSRPGEGIYNDASGAVEGNSPFQVCWLSDEKRDAELDRVRAMAEARPEMDAAPVVFEGNAPADVRENAVLAHALRVRATAVPTEARVWLGAPNSIKGPTEAVFSRQSGSNLLIVGQRDDAALAMLGTALVALATQYPVGGVRLVLLHQLAMDSADGRFVEELVGGIGHEVTVAGAEHLDEVMAMLGEELERRKEGDAGGKGPETFVLVHGLQRFRKLRTRDEFDFSTSDSGPTAASHFGELMAEGSALGMHVLASVDGFNSVGKFINRKALSEFEKRVVFQMSANDSASLIDSPRAGNLGLHRAILYSEHSGTMEIFRPYALPDALWIAEVAAMLGRAGVVESA